MCFCCVSHFARQLLHLSHLNKVEQVGEGARVEQGDVAGGKAHLRVGGGVGGRGVVSIVVLVMVVLSMMVVVLSIVVEIFRSLCW